MKVLKSWGTDGRVVMSLSGVDPEGFDLDEPVFITFDGLPVPFFIESIEPKGNRLIAKLEDIDTLEAAEEIVGREVRLGEDEDGEDDDSIVGMIVRNAADGRLVGPVTGVDDFAGNTCLAVDYNGKEVILPFHEDLVVECDDSTLTLTIPDGLLDL